MEYEMDDILLSIINGQRKQALYQLANSTYLFVDLVAELKPAEVIAMIRVADSVGYISYNPANVRSF